MDDNQQQPELHQDTYENHPQISLINAFTEITTCASKSEALFYLESHNFDLDSAVSTFFDSSIPPVPADLDSPPSDEPVSVSPSTRSRSPSPTSRSYNLRSGSSGDRRNRRGRIRLSDLNSNDDEGSGSDPDFDPQEMSGMPVQEPSRANTVAAIFDQAIQAGGVPTTAEHLMPSSSSRSFTGAGRLLSGAEPAATPTPQQPEVVNHYITFWRNGFTVNDGPLRGLDDPENASFLKSISTGACPRELVPTDKGVNVEVRLIKKGEDYKEPPKRHLSFGGVGRTLGSTSDATLTETATALIAMYDAPLPSPDLIVDQTQPCTSIQFRLADGTRMVSRFNNSHTIRDIRGFIDASRPNGSRTYQLQTVFPTKQLTDLDQTIDEAGIANSVVIQKL